MAKYEETRKLNKAARTTKKEAKLAEKQQRREERLLKLQEKKQRKKSVKSDKGTQDAPPPVKKEVKEPGPKKEKPSWICEECGKTFTVKASLQAHMDLHRYEFLSLYCI